jgi:hypothetical protein
LLASRVDRPEARRGESNEQARMASDSLREALATAKPGGDELPGVRTVDLGTGRAAARAAVAACLEQDPVRLIVGREALADLAGLLVDLLDLADQADRPGAVAGVLDLPHPTLEAVVVGRSGDELIDDGR